MKSLNNIDLRSDTVTLPPDGMRGVVLDARLGDDVIHEDYTTNDLENKAAKMFNKEAALFVPSGTMGNLVSVLTHCNRGDEIIVGDKSHTFYYEAGGISAYGSVHSRQLKNNEDGTIDLNTIKHSIRTEDDHFPTTKLICLENTHNICGGAPLSLEYLKSIKELATKNNLKVHIDGARIFNAAIATKAQVSQIAQHSDSLTFCLSKGLSSPVGSIICGKNKFISQARKIRKGLGGGMRQSGVIACFGIYALDNMIEQLTIDHNNAQYMAMELNKSDQIIINPQEVQTNLIYFKLSNINIPPKDFIKGCNKSGLLFYYTGNDRYRLVTHFGIVRQDVQKAIEIIFKVLNSLNKN